MLDVVLSAIAAFALIVVNGVFVAAEFAIVRVRRTRLEELAGEGKANAKEAIELVDKLSDYLTTTQVGITAASLGVGWLGEHAFSQVFLSLTPEHAASSRALIHGVSTIAAFFLVTMMHVVLGEIVPKNLAVARADDFLMRLVRPLRVFHRVVRPVSRLFTGMASCVQRGLGYANAPPPALSEEELKLVLSDSREDGILTAGEAKIILRAFEFADRSAEAIMVPRHEVDYLSLTRTFDENLATARRHMHARLPLCKRGLDSVIGVVNLKDVWLLGARADNRAFERAARPVTKVPKDLSQEAILRRLQEDRSQLAVVRDVRDRRTLGVVTLEDVLESLVGDVREARLAEARATR